MAMTADKTPNSACQIGNRYIIQETLGIGGMGSVYRVRDESTGRTLALKRLHKTAIEKRPEYVALFQHEYHTLAQLTHPLIIAVYDYGVEEQEPYYTMEFLPGDDLHQMAPVEWQKACALLRDIAISLAILHSRRVVHRDVSLHNVRCNEVGRAKLIDFGAMTPMGITKKVVGTPPFIAPEVMTQQPVDGRADLYSLGAVAYYLLTGRYAFYSKTITGMIDAWRSRPAAPSTIAPDIPPALDNLVFSLLNLDKLARPVNAAEVIDRLNAIADLPEEEPLKVSQAYLCTPPLAGRERYTTLFRKMMPSIMVSRGGAVTVESAAGVGRSRLLNAFILEGKLAGALVITATAVDAQKGEYGVIRALIDDLLAATPTETLVEAEKDGRILGHVSPELHEKLGYPQLLSVANHFEHRARVQIALQSLFTSYSTNRRLMIAVDDVHNCDEPSLAVLASLSRSAHRLKLILAVTTESEALKSSSEAVRMIKDSGTVIELQPLTIEDNNKLIQSMFGDVPNTNIVADWVFELSRGNVRTCMELVQHLVDNGIARYQDGNWILPKNLREQDLPQSLEHALEARIKKLSASAKDLAESLSLVTEYAPLKLEHYVVLNEELDEKMTFSALDELVASQVLLRSHNHYRFDQPGFVDVLQANLSDERKRDIHIRLVTTYKSGDYGRPLVLVHHLQQAGKEEKALELLIQLLEKAETSNESYSLQVQCYETALAQIECKPGYKKERFLLRKALISLARKFDFDLLRYNSELEKQLRVESGLVFWDSVDNSLAPSDRIKQCVMKALANWEATPENERGLNPMEAIKELVAYAGLVAAVAGPMFNTALLSHMHSLVEPYHTISPAVDLLERLVDIALHQVMGKPVYHKRLEFQKLYGQSVSDLDEHLRRDLVDLTNSYYLALVEASNANPLALDRADYLEQNPRFTPHAWEVRLIAHLFSGRSHQALACLRHKELLAVQNPESDVHLLSGLVFEAWAYSICGDLMGLKQLLIPITEKADLFAGWIPFMLWVRGNYHFLRGELSQARRDLEKMIGIAPIGQHFGWWRGIPVLVETLIEMGEFEQARLVTEESIETAEKISPHPEALRDLYRVLAFAEAKLGNINQAIERIESTIDKARSENVGGVPLGMLYETAAWIALEAQDDDRFGAYTELTAKQYKTGSNPALNAKMQKLKEVMQRHQLPLVDAFDTGWTMEKELGATVTASIMASIPPLIDDALKISQTPDERAQRALNLLIEHTQADEVFLYASTPEGLVLAAPLEQTPPPGLTSLASEYLKELTIADTEKTITMSSDFDGAVENQRKLFITDDGCTFQPVILSNQTMGGAKIVGIAALKIRQGTPFDPAWNMIAVIGKLLV